MCAILCGERQRGSTVDESEKSRSHVAIAIASLRPFPLPLASLSYRNQNNRQLVEIFGGISSGMSPQPTHFHLSEHVLVDHRYLPINITLVPTIIGRHTRRDRVTLFSLTQYVTRQRGHSRGNQAISVFVMKSQNISVQDSSVITSSRYVVYVDRCARPRRGQKSC